MVSINLDQIKKSLPEDLGDDDVKTLQKNWDTLDEEEKDFYKDLAPTKEEDTPPETEEPEKEVEGDDAEESSLTENKIRNIFRGEIKEYLKTRNPKKPVSKEEKEWFGEEWQPKDYNEFAETFYNKAINRMQKEAEDRRTQQEEKIQQANQRITDELNQIDGIPEEGTKERVEFERDFTKWAINYGVTGSVERAYELYQKTQDNKTKVSSKQKKTQSKVARGGGGSSTQDKTKNYSSDVRDRSMDDIIASAVDKWDNLSE